MTTEKINILEEAGQQLALDLFRAGVKEVTQSPEEIGYKKPHMLIQLNDLGVVARRVVNACFFLVSATKNDTLNTDFFCDAKYFKWLCGFESNNTTPIFDALDKSRHAEMRIAEMDNPTDGDYINSMIFQNTGRIRGAVYFQLNSKIHQILLRSNSLTFMSMRYLSAFTSKYAGQIYERLRMLIDENDEYTSEWISVDSLSEWITQRAGAKMPEWKIARRDMLDPALEQITQISDLRVDLETRSGGGTRKIVAFRFLAKRHPEKKFAKDTSEQEDRIRKILQDEFKLSDKDLEEVMGGDYKIEKIWSVVEYTQDQKRQNKVRLPARFFLTALRDNWNVSKSENTDANDEHKKDDGEKREKRKKEQDKLAEKQEKDKQKAAGVTPASQLSEDELAGAWAHFLKTLSGKLVKSRSHIQASAREKDLFEKWWVAENSRTPSIKQVR